MFKLLFKLGDYLTKDKEDGYDKYLIRTSFMKVKVSCSDNHRYLTVHMSTDKKMWNYTKYDLDLRTKRSGKYPYRWVK